MIVGQAPAPIRGPLSGHETGGAPGGGRSRRSSRVRVLIADDEREIRGAVAALIASEPGLELVAEAADAAQAIEMAREARPDVALVDVKMPEGGGPTATKGIQRDSPATKVLALSAFQDRTTVLEMLGAGAVGYLVKGTSPREVVRSIRRAANGQSSLSAGVMGSVVGEIRTQIQRAEAESEERRVRLIRVREAIAGDGLWMAFQPIFDLAGRAIVGYEALARFAGEPPRPPDVWFAEAASLGLGVDLELTAVRMAIAEAERIPSHAYLSVNVSHHAATSAEILDLLGKGPLGRMVIEITEHEQVQDYDALLEGVRELRAFGVRLAIDDAGAGYASLRHTLRLAPDIIKLDTSITRGIDVDRARRALAHALISFAAEMEMVIVAEGIETPDELAAMLDLGVRYGQGFHLARPGPLP
jgi:EAL domain-containing protein (putative c-di-GMP-specific phosphodiesterase class I)/DNA-binding NarL/FixJ family response regulator